MMCLFFGRVLLALAVLFAAVPAAAHQQKLAISTVSINPRTDRVEIVHQVPLHDAEHALRHGGVHSPDIVGRPESRRAFADYVTDRFRVRVGDRLAELSFVGSEVKGGSLWVYQEMPLPPSSADVAINSQILTDVWARQENRVNLGGGTDVETLIFRAGDGFKRGELRR